MIMAEKLVCPVCGSTLKCRGYWVKAVEYQFDEDGNLEGEKELSFESEYEEGDWECTKDSCHDLSELDEEKLHKIQMEDILGVIE